MKILRNKLTIGKTEVKVENGQTITKRTDCVWEEGRGNHKGFLYKSIYQRNDKPDMRNHSNI